jgi:uncharacterized cupredoxin-like copper-binding protein
MHVNLNRLLGISAAACIALASPAAFSHGDGDEHKPAAGKAAISAEVHAWGQEGDPRKAKRTVKVDMADTMRFNPAVIQVKRGETVRFVVRNTGKLMHEMVIGTEEDLAKHAELMKKFPEMEHEAPYMAHVKPGATQQIVWTFSKPGTFHYGCLEPGHWEAGMKGSIVVAAK